MECQFGDLPLPDVLAKCEACHKLRDRADVLRCRRSGPRIEGLGDVIEVFTRKTGIQAIVKAINPDCGCDHRQREKNQQFPLGNPDD